MGAMTIFNRLNERRIDEASFMAGIDEKEKIYLPVDPSTDVKIIASASVKVSLIKLLASSFLTH